MSEVPYYPFYDIGGRNRADIHVHTSATDGSMSYEQVVHAALEAGLHTIVITDHDTISPSVDAKAYNERRHQEQELTVLTGSEVTTADGHVLAIGVQDDIPKGESIEATLLKIHKQGGLAIAAHPGLSYGGGMSFETIQRVMQSEERDVFFDGIEVYNANAAKIREIPIFGWMLPDTNWNTRALYQKHGSKLGAAVGGSDAHGRLIGLGVTNFDGACLFDAIRDKRTTVSYRDNPLSGFAELRSQIVNAHINPRFRQKAV